MSPVARTAKETLLSLHDFLALVEGKAGFKERLGDYRRAITDILGELQENKMAIDDLESQVEYWKGKAK